MKTTRFLSVAAPVTVAALFSARAAPGDQAAAVPSGRDAQAETHIARGLELRRQRQDARALEEFRAAYELEQGDSAEGDSDVRIAQRALAQIALAEDALGLWVDAEEAFEQVLADHSDAWVEKRRAQLGEELGILRAHLAEVELDVTPAAGAEVLINGSPAHRRAGTNAFRVISGRVLFEVRSPGFETARRVVALTPGAHEREAVTLVPVPPTAAAAPPPADTAVTPPEPGPASLAVASPRPSPQPSSKTSARSLLAISSLGVAGAAFLVGTVGAVGRAVYVNEYNDNNRCDFGGVPRSIRCAGIANESNGFTTVMTVGYIASAASALAGGIFAFTLPKDVRVDVSETGKTGFVVWARKDF